MINDAKTAVDLNENLYQTTGAISGFWVGLWNGIIAPLIFLIGLFTTKVKVYETNNNGRWYDFGFLLGIGAFAGSSKKATG